MPMKGKRVLVTGGSGFIASHLCRRLVDAGADLTVLVKYNSVIDNVRLVGIWDQINIIESDLRNPDSLRPLSEIRPQIIYHMAAYNHVGDSFSQVSEAFDSNGKGTVNLLESYGDYERFIYISTSEVYGLQTTVPFQEDATPAPLSPYAVGKYAGEVYSRMMWNSHNKPVVMIRPFNCYGPYQSNRAVIPELITKCLQNADVVTTEGLQTREFNFVSNLIDGFMMAGSCPNLEGQTINLGCGREVSIRDLVHMIHTLTGSSSELKIGKLPTRSGEIIRMSADRTRAWELMGWEPKVHLEQGLATTIEWYRRYLQQFGDANSDLALLGQHEEPRD